MEFSLIGDQIAFGGIVFAHPAVCIMVDGREYHISVGYTHMCGQFLEGGYCDDDFVHVRGYTISMAQIRSPNRDYFGVDPSVPNPSGA